MATPQQNLTTLAKSANYGLYLPKMTDPPNQLANTENFKILDDLLGNATDLFLVTGTYTGDGAADRTINFGFTPKAVLVLYAGSGFMMSGVPGGLAIPGFYVSDTHNTVTTWGSSSAIGIVNNGIRVAFTGGAGMKTNCNGWIYFYIAFK